MSSLAKSVARKVLNLVNSCQLVSSLLKINSCEHHMHLHLHTYESYLNNPLSLIEL